MKSYKRLVKLTDISNVTELLGSKDMAMSKVKSEKFPILERINKLDYASNIERRIVDDEIDIFCVQEEKKGRRLNIRFKLNPLPFATTVQLNPLYGRPTLHTAITKEIEH